MTCMSACPAVGELRGWLATFAARSASCDSALGRSRWLGPPDGTAASYAADVDAVPEDNRLVIDNQRTKSCGLRPLPAHTYRTRIHTKDNQLGGPEAGTRGGRRHTVLSLILIDAGMPTVLWCG